VTDSARAEAALAVHAIACADDWPTAAALCAAMRATPGDERTAVVAIGGQPAKRRLGSLGVRADATVGIGASGVRTAALALRRAVVEQLHRRDTETCRLVVWDDTAAMLADRAALREWGEVVRAPRNGAHAPLLASALLPSDEQRVAVRRSWHAAAGDVVPVFLGRNGRPVDAAACAYHSALAAFNGAASLGVFLAGQTVQDDRAHRFRANHDQRWRDVYDERSPVHVIAAADVAVIPRSPSPSQACTLGVELAWAALAGKPVVFENAAGGNDPMTHGDLAAAAFGVEPERRFKLGGAFARVHEMLTAGEPELLERLERARSAALDHDADSWIGAVAARPRRAEGRAAATA
jgi:hypothetical protein